MRVLHTNFLRGWGGQSNRILEECRGLAQRGWDVLLSVPSGSELARRARAAGLAVDESVSYQAFMRSLLTGDMAKFRRLVVQWGPDIIHLHGGRDSWIAALALAWRTRPIILRTKHNIFPIADHPANRWLYGRFFDGIVCISSAIVEQCAAKRYIAPDRLVLIPSACDVARFVAAAGAREAMRREFGFQPDDVVIVMSGRFRPEKGHDVLLAAAAQVVAAQPRTRFLLLGAGSLQGSVAAELEREGLANAVVVAGFRTDVPECLAAADIAVQPSRSEGLGTAVLEAAAAGLPVVATAVGGIPDIVVHGQTGLLVPPEDPRALAEALIELAGDPQRRAAWGRAGRERVAAHFSVEALVEKTDAYYRRMIESQQR
jgi:glycosyltransferase involved in cell wall biosynthesis